MGENNKRLKSIWGKWWEPLRKWFYPLWLIYETSIRFYDYAISVYSIIDQQFNHPGDLMAQIVAVFCSAVTFIICIAFLTLPACFVLFKFFSIENLSNTIVEKKLKPNF